MVGITIRNEVNQNNKPIGISFRRKDQLSGDVVCSVLEKVTQSNAERALIGTWVMDEVRLAVQKGYEVTEIFEVYEHKVTQFARGTGDGGMFVHYINTFLKLKA
jgi:hypothetical protein